MYGYGHEHIKKRKSDEIIIKLIEMPMIKKHVIIGCSVATTVSCYTEGKLWTNHLIQCKENVNTCLHSVCLLSSE